MHTEDVVIVGAGPNGLMLACELGLAGIRPVVLDSMAAPNPDPRANRIVGQAPRLLDHRGIYGELTGTAEPPRPAALSFFAGFPLDLSSVAGSQLFTVPIQQRGLVHVLVDRAAEYGADVRWGHDLTGFEQSGDGVTVHATGPDGAYALRTRYLVGADGGTSKTRHVAGIDFPGVSSYDLVMRMAFDVEPPQEWMAPAGSDATGAVALPPLRFHRTERGVFSCGAMGSRVVAMTYELDGSPRERRDADSTILPPMSLAELELSATRVLGVDVPLRPTSPGAPTDLRRISGINSRIASTYRVGRLFLLGDAAHVHSPIGGPGLNLSQQDAVNLGWKLAAVLDGRVGPELLDTYESERRPAAERVIMQSRVQLGLLRPGLEVTAQRELFSEMLTEPGAVGRLSDLLSGADVRYPAAPDCHPLVGRWVPDFAVASAVGTQRIAELARSGRPLLVDLTERGAIAAELADVADRLTVAVGRAVGEVAATALLVRPDGYVAWASAQSEGSPDELRELRRLLGYWFGISLSAQQFVR